jgi:hypothetical protein
LERLVVAPLNLLLCIYFISFNGVVVGCISISGGICLLFGNVYFFLVKILIFPALENIAVFIPLL